MTAEAAMRAEERAAPRYRAFVSYCHADLRWADWLHDSLERFRVPSRLAGTLARNGVIPRCLRPIFLDRVDLGATADLDADIARALRESAALIVICSPAAVASSRVAREIDLFRQQHGTSRILTLLVGGRPNAVKRGLPDGEECLPAALRPGVERAAAAHIGTLTAAGTDPLGADVRTGRGSKPAALLKLVAGLLGVDADQLRRARAVERARRLKFVVPLAILLAFIALAANRYLQSRRAEINQPSAATRTALHGTAVAEVSDKSIAVLPFADLSERKDQGYFVDGLSDELIDSLARIPELRVPARTSSYYFKGRAAEIATIARQLRVANVLEGSVRTAGARMRVTVQLIRADTGYHLWSNTYDRATGDIFKLQDDISRAVVRALQISLAQGPLAGLGGTADKEAYKIFLQGRYMYQNGTDSEAGERSADYLRQAVRRDPHFANAWAFLAFNRSARADVISGAGRMAGSEARHAASMAIAMDPVLPNAHAAMSSVYWYVDWNWTGALAEAEQAYRLAPDGHALDLARLLMVVGRDDARIERLMRGAVEDDPASAFSYWNLGLFYLDSGRLAAAEAALRKSLDLNPLHGWVPGSLSKVLLFEGKPKAALTEIEHEPDEMYRACISAMIYDALGNKDKAAQQLRLAEATPADEATCIAGVYARRGDRARAFAWLDRAVTQREFRIMLLRRDPLFNGLRDDPRYQVLVRRLNLPD